MCIKRYCHETTMICCETAVRGCVYVYFIMSFYVVMRLAADTVRWLVVFHGVCMSGYQCVLTCCWAALSVARRVSLRSRRRVW